MPFRIWEAGLSTQERWTPFPAPGTLETVPASLFPFRGHIPQTKSFLPLCSASVLRGSLITNRPKAISLLSMPAAGIGWQSCKPSVTVNKGEKYIMEANYIWKKTLKGKEENSTLSSAETSLSHDLECSHLLRSVTNSHGSERRRSSSSAPTPLLLPSLSSVRGAFCHSSSHLVNGCDTSNLCSVLHTECLHQAKQPHQPRASSWAAAHVGSPAPRSTGLGILSYLCDWPY